ncbi:MAG: hypothetical protein JWQ04_474 [Pedosphaera sp.]|nr:hypothetical protein [Pedosphaera sp.]
MKIKSVIQVAAALLLSTLNHQLSTAFAQGSLTPPGAPASSMKSLDQIEPRTPISSAPFAIAKPGSYYLTTNVTVSAGNAITINTSQVTLDLNGFTISSTAPSASGTGILLAATNTDVTILNGHITGGVTNSAGVFSGSGFANGIFYTNSSPFNVHVTGVSVSGCLSNGIQIGVANSTIVESCTVKTVGNYGIYADNVSRCTVKECGNTGILSEMASDSRADCVGNGVGINSGNVQNCYGNNVGNGVGLGATVANNSTGNSTAGYGMTAVNANNCYASSSGANPAISVNMANNCYGQCSGSGTGLLVNGTATGSFGYSFTGIGINAHIANSCTVGGGTTNIAFKYNMP